MIQKTKQYFIDFFEEKDNINDTFVVEDKKGNTHIFDKQQVLVEILSMSKPIQESIRKKFIQIDLKNSDINQFIEYILKGLIK